MCTLENAVNLYQTHDKYRAVVETEDQETFIIYRDEGAFSVTFLDSDTSRKYLALTDDLVQPYDIACDFGEFAASWYGMKILVGDRLILMPAQGRHSRLAPITCLKLDGKVIAGTPLEIAAERHSDWTLLGILGLLLAVVGLGAITMFESYRAGGVTMFLGLAVVAAGLIGRSAYSWARPHTSLVP